VARRGGVLPGRLALGLAVVLGGTAATAPGLLASTGKPTPRHGAPRIIQDRVPDLPGTGRPDKYAPNVCHPNDEQPASPAQLDAWITRAGQLLHRPYSPDERRIVLVVIDGEAFGGKVHSINCWDRNWSEGHPSMGLMQTIDTTYMAHAPKGCRRLDLVYDGPCNIAAGTHYAIGRYGSLAAIPGVGEVQAGGDYSTGY
jgi:hypothetical protein